METGIVSEESLQTLLRQIGQKRRQGVLELSYPSGKVEVWFHQGKAVEASVADAVPAVHVLEMLRRGGVVPENFSWSPSLPEGHATQGERPHCQSFSGHYRALFLALAQSGVTVDGELYRRVIRQHVLNQIYSLDLQGGAIFNFKPQVIEIDREFAPTISVGQLLLDLVALPHNQERFGEVFPEGSWVSRSEMPEGVLTVEERILYDCLSEPLPCTDLRERAMLSAFHFMDALLALHERGLLSTQIGPIRTSSLSVRDMVHRTVLKSVEAEVVVGSLLQKATAKPHKATVAPQPSVTNEVGTENGAHYHAEQSSAVTSNHEPEQGASEAQSIAPVVERDSQSKSEHSSHAHRAGGGWSLRVLESAAAVQFIAVLYVLIAFAVPWLSWGKILQFFAQ